MHKRNEDKNVYVPLTLGINDLAKRYGIGLNKAREIGAESGAKIRIGSRVVYRVDLVDAYVLAHAVTE